MPDRRDTSVPFVGLEVHLHGCVEKESLDALISELRQWLVEKLNPDFHSDVSVELALSAGLVSGNEELAE